MTITYDENTEGNSHAWEYCVGRMIRFEAFGISSNPTYVATYRSFINFWVSKMAHYPMVDDEDDEDETVLETYVSRQGTVYITQANVEAYFEQVVVPTLRGDTCTIRKIVSALNVFLKTVENHQLAAITTPILYTNRIVQAMNEQHLLYQLHTTQKQAGQDPHNNVRDIYSEDEVGNIVDSMFKLKKDSFHLLFAYTWGKNAGVRGASSRVMCLCDLNLSYGYGPDPSSGPNNCTLLLIHRPGPKHKNRFRIPKQVGVQRHRDYRQCAVFCTGALLILRLRDLEDEINFLKPGKNGRALWWDKPLNYYKSYSEESSAMRQVLAAAGIYVQHGGKLTHHRTQMVQTAGSRGLQPYQVCTMTKHIPDKLHSAYLPEVEEETMKVMSGFRKGETRYVATEHVRFPGTHQAYIDKCTKYLIPNYGTYVKDQQSHLGDKTVAAIKFLYHVIPHLVETVLQCGYWFIHDYPDHPLASLLKVSKSTALAVLYN